MRQANRNRRSAYRAQMARARRVKHSAQIIAWVLRATAALCFFGILGAVGGIEHDMNIADGLRMMLIFAAGSGFCIVSAAWIERAVGL